MKKVIIISVVLLLLVGGGAAAYFLLMKDDAPAAAEGGAEAAPVIEEKEPIYFALHPEFIINYQHGGSTRYLQMSLQIMAHDQKVIDKVEANMPAVRNTLIMLMSGMDFDGWVRRKARRPCAPTCSPPSMKQ